MPRIKAAAVDSTEKEPEDSGSDSVAVADPPIGDPIDPATPLVGEVNLDENSLDEDLSFEEGDEEENEIPPASAVRVGRECNCEQCEDISVIQHVDGTVSLNCGHEYPLQEFLNSSPFEGFDDDRDDDEHGDGDRIESLEGNELILESSSNLSAASIENLTAGLKSITVPIKDVFDTGENIRKVYDQRKLEETAASIRTKGLLQPLLTRKKEKQGYPLVDGHRRLKSAAIAGLETIAIFVHPTMTAAEAREYMLVANLQREDLDPLDEAAVFNEMLQSAPNVTLEEVAARSGKTPRYVSQRLRFLQLPEFVLQRMREGLEARTALLFARIGDPTLRNQAALKILSEQEMPRLTHGSVEQQINRDYMRLLQKAPFDVHDPTLNPKQGACDGCPFRTGNATDLFGAGDRADVCTNGACFQLKADNQFARLLETQESGGHICLTGAAAAAVFDHWGTQVPYGSEYIEANGTISINYSQKQIAELLGDKEIKTFYAKHDRSGNIMKLYLKSDVLEAAKANGVKIKANDDVGGMSRKKTDAEKKRELNTKIENLADRLAKVAVGAAFAKALKKPEIWNDIDIWKAMFNNLGNCADQKRELNALHGWKSEEKGEFATQVYDRNFKKMDNVEDVRNEFFAMLLMQYCYGQKKATVDVIASKLGIDLKPFKLQAQEKLTPKKKEKAPKAEKKPKLDKSAKAANVKAVKEAPKIVKGARVFRSIQGPKGGTGVVKATKGVNASVLWDGEKKPVNVDLLSLSVIAATPEKAPAKKPAAAKAKAPKAKAAKPAAKKSAKK